MAHEYLTFLLGNYIFQQNSALAHPSKKTRMAQDECHQFLGQNIWPINSQDLNPLDFSVWSMVEAKACKAPHPNIQTLKTSVAKACRSLS